MRFRRSAAAAACVAVVAAIGVSGASMVTSAAPARSHHAVVHHPSASYLKQARAALVHYLKTHRSHVLLAHPGTVTNPTTTTSFNWGGYADSSTANAVFTKVSASWKMPKVTCTNEDQLTSEWVGIDGYTSSTVEQDGTLGWCFQGSATYYTWYEMYPAGTITVGTTIQPGDAVDAAVTRTGTSYKLTVTDNTRSGNDVSKTATCAASTCLANSAEWIIERPAFSIGIAPLAKFSKWTLTKGSVTANGTTGGISSYTQNGSPIRMSIIDATQTYGLSTTTALTGGNKFSSTWLNSY